MIPKGPCGNSSSTGLFVGCALIAMRMPHRRIRNIPTSCISHTVKREFEFFNWIFSCLR